MKIEDAPAELVAAFQADMKIVDAAVADIIKVTAAIPGWRNSLLIMVATRLLTQGLNQIGNGDARLTAFHAHIQALAFGAGLEVETQMTEKGDTLQ